MVMFITIAFLILFVFIFITQYFFKKKLQITDEKLHLFKANRVKLFLFLEAITVSGFIIFFLTYMNHLSTNDFPMSFIPKLTLILLFVISIIRGVELYIYQRRTKAYYYEFTGAALFILLYILVLFGEQYFL